MVKMEPRQILTLQVRDSRNKMSPIQENQDLVVLCIYNGTETSDEEKMYKTNHNGGKARVDAPTPSSSMESRASGRKAFMSSSALSDRETKTAMMQMFSSSS